MNLFRFQRPWNKRGQEHTNNHHQHWWDLKWIEMEMWWWTPAWTLYEIFCTILLSLSTSSLIPQMSPFWVTSSPNIILKYTLVPLKSMARAARSWTHSIRMNMLLCGRITCTIPGLLVLSGKSNHSCCAPPLVWQQLTNSFHWNWWAYLFNCLLHWTAVFDFSCRSDIYSSHFKLLKTFIHGLRCSPLGPYGNVHQERPSTPQNILSNYITGMLSNIYNC